ncbi:hypothetical protein ACFWIN_37835 [Streptomyces sp. NPDC127049]|uniref:hypothetical protein n=1 Tax=Streptomyces sp. NPDC127049 TaxID=3347118 RepID=UPI0036603434
MISEPELVGGAPFETAEVLTEEREPRPPRGRRPWLWGLGGALVASALWGAGLYTYGLVQQRDEGMDLGGYKPVENLCEVSELKAMGMVLGKRAEDGVGPYFDEPALSESSCSVNYGEEDRQQSVQLSYTLHKVTDPGPEFEARAKYYELTQPIAGLGEKALFNDQGEAGGAMWVLDGQVELRIDMYVNVSYDEQGRPMGEGPQPDLSGIDVPMTQDALALLAALKK